MKGAERIVAERQRQIEVEGYDPERDEDPWQLALAGAAYLLAAAGRLAEARVVWPWPMESFKHRDFVRDVERGGALAAAALDGHDLLARVVLRMSPDVAEQLAMLVSDHASHDEGWRIDSEHLFEAAEEAR